VASFDQSCLCGCLGRDLHASLANIAPGMVERRRQTDRPVKGSYRISRSSILGTFPVRCSSSPSLSPSSLCSSHSLTRHHASCCCVLWRILRPGMACPAPVNMNLTSFQKLTIPRLVSIHTSPQVILILNLIAIFEVLNSTRSVSSKLLCKGSNPPSMFD